MATPEYVTILKCLPQLEELLASDPSLADNLLTEGFIPPASKRMKLTDGDTDLSDRAKEASQFVNNILNQIKAKADRYNEFIAILRKNPNRSREGMVELLEKTYPGI